MSRPLLPLKNWASLLVALSFRFPNLVGLKLLGAWEEVWGVLGPVLVPQESDDSAHVGCGFVVRKPF